LDSDRLEEIAGRMREAAFRAGADDAECLARWNESVGIDMRKGKVDGVRRKQEASASLRVLKDGREGMVFTTAPEESLYSVLAQEALDCAGLMPLVEGNRFSPAREFKPVEGLFDGSGLSLSFEEKVQMARSVEDAVLSADPRIEQAHKPSYHEQGRKTAIASGGRVWSFEDTVFSLSVEAVARSEGESQSGYEYRVSRRLADLEPSLVGASGAREAVELLGGGMPPTGTFPGVLPPKAALDLLGPLLSSFSAEEMIKKRSRLEGRRGEKVFPDCLTLTDDGTLPWHAGSIAFDDERVPPVPRNIVEKGVVLGCFHTLRTAAIMGEEPTGNGFRPSMTASPVPEPSNLFIPAGSRSTASLMPSGKAIRITGVMGTHTIDQVSGDFSLGASGQILEDGQAVRPFRNGTISGNLFELMASLSAVGDDLTFYGSMGCPTLFFAGVLVSGT